MTHPETVVILLDRLKSGDVNAADELYQVVYGDLHARAQRLLNAQPHTLQATALVHEAWIKLCAPEGGPGSARPRDRAHFVSIAAKAMRSVLVDHARAKHALKRGGARERVLLDEALAVYTERVPDVVELHEELEKLAALDPRAAEVVELRFFGGLSIAETAELMKLSHATVERDWQAARAFLAARLDPDRTAPPPDGR